ncbi:MAG: hypothetical protein VX341_02995 [Bdellovibrionota bacterium]|nr:hypothetical protein [Bdellovibrionota bacterium]
MQKLLISFLIAGQVFFTWSASSTSLSILENFSHTGRNFNNQYISLKNTPKQTIIAEDAKLRLTNSQLQTILFYGNQAYNEIYFSEPCSLAYFLQNDNVIIRNKRIKEVEVEIIKDKGITKALIDAKFYAKRFLNNNCPDFKKREELFSSTNLRGTLERYALVSPRNKQDCYSQYKKFKDSKDLPYLCSRIDKIIYSALREDYLEKNPSADIETRLQISNLRKEKEEYRPKFSDFEFNYFTNLCKNLGDQEVFCANYISQDVWGLIQNSQEPDYKMKYKCLSLLKKETLKKMDINQCINLFRNKSHLCYVFGSLNNSSLLPMPSCKDISKSLTASKLVADYHDCPSEVANPSVINFNRIIKHFFPDKIKISRENCVFPSFESVYSAYLDTKEEKKWPLKLCYKDTLDKKERCYPYVPGNNREVSYSQNSIVSDILYEARLNETRPKCNFGGNKYNPARLKYKTNCWILPLDKKCSRYDCPLKVILDGKEVIKVYSKGKLNFQYFENQYNSNDSPLNKRLINQFEMKTSSISSVSSASFFLKQKSKGIIHGIGCLEDIYPDKFRIQGATQCSPMPFIIDGFKKDGELAKFTLRTAIDDLHSPREVSWPIIYSAVERYSSYHPLKKWNLYGIY